MQGPWKLCFKVDRSGVYRPPSLMIELTYFTINHRSLIGTSYEHEKLTTQPLPPGAHEEHPHAAVRAQSALPQKEPDCPDPPFKSGILSCCFFRSVELSSFLA